MADWLKPFLEVTPWIAWFFAGVGVPWALVLLPRHDWRDWTMVVGVGLALGPVLGTTWLFLLGTFGRFTWEAATGGTIVLVIVALGLIWHRRRASTPSLASDGEIAYPPVSAEPRFRALTFALLVMMAIALLANVWDTAFWPFLRYDTLWTFGYNPKIFMLKKQIPDSMDYYPQLVPLTFTFGTLKWGSFNDHAARAAVPWFLLSSGFAAYLLGWRVYGRRLTGLLTAALWLLLPSGLVWSSAGDLEHPMALYFTMATVFFVLAWRTHVMHYAVIAGLMAGGAMWTKPTAGSFVLGIGLVMSGTAVYAGWWHDFVWFRGKVQIALVTLVVSAPIGGMWYVRNLLLGHAWTTLPAKYWQTFAQRSGMQLHWLWLLAGLVTFILLVDAWKNRQRRWQDFALPLMAFVLLSVAILPTALSVPADGWTYQTSWGWINGFREPERRLNLVEGILLILGSLLLIWSGRYVWYKMAVSQQQAFVLTWGIGLPFFTVYFWAFSYHYRLALTVMPLIFAPLAALIAGWIIPVLSQNGLRRAATVIIVVMLGLPAPVAATYHTALNTFNQTGLKTDRQKAAYANPALMQLVDFLEKYAYDNQRETLRILAPGENRLSFYFPTWQIDDTLLPTDLTDLAGYDLFVKYAADFLWRTYRLEPNQVQAWTRLAWVYPLAEWDKIWAFDGPYGAEMPRVLKPAVQVIDDGKDRYEVFAIYLEAATRAIKPETPLNEVIFGDAIELSGYDLPTRRLKRGEAFTLKLYWRGTLNAPVPGDYSIFVHLRDPQTGQVLDQVDGGLMYGLFPMRLLTPGMVFQDRREWRIREEVRPGPATLWIGIYDPQDEVRLPVTVDGEAAGDGFLAETDLVIE